MAERIFKTKDAQIFYESARNSEQWIVFIHGATTNHTFFSHQARFFQEIGYSTLALDLRGEGYSTPKPADAQFYSLENHTSDLEKILSAEKIEKPVLVGHSCGGMIAADYEARHKGSSNAVVLLDSSYDFTKTLTLGAKGFYLLRKLFRLYFTHINNSAQKRGIKAEYTDFSKLGKASDIDFARMTYERAEPASVPSMHALSEAILTWSIEEQLREIRCPVLAIHAGKSQFVRPSTMFVLRDIVGGDYLRPVLFPKAKHQFPIQDPSLTNAAIQIFLTTI